MLAGSGTPTASRSAFICTLLLVPSAAMFRSKMEVNEYVGLVRIVALDAVTLPAPKAVVPVELVLVPLVVNRVFVLL